MPCNLINEKGTREAADGKNNLLFQGLIKFRETSWVKFNNENAL